MEERFWNTALLGLRRGAEEWGRGRWGGGGKWG